jgi:phosphate:Na+ symporter
MDIFDLLTMVGGLCLFLFGMNIMGEALERRAGDSLRTLLGKLTTNKFAGFLTGMAVTAVIQSSSATTVMVVGFVNSGLLKLGQAINVIMGANVGTTVTAWVLSLGAIDGDSLFIQLLKPTSFTPVLALIGVVFYVFLKDGKKKDTGMILLGFATLMFGMDTMSDAVSGLKDVPQFQQLFLMFQNPILGTLAGAVLTAIIQSSSASVGILQALAVTGSVSYGAAIPIIMGQNIGTCITAMLSGVGATKNAKRTALVHLSFNVIGTAVWLAVFALIRSVFQPALLEMSADAFGIAVSHSIFNVLCTVLLFPCSGLLEKLVCQLVPDSEEPEQVAELDERLLATPPVALMSCREMTAKMADAAAQGLRDSASLLTSFDPATAKAVKKIEDLTDHYEDILGTYLVKLSSLSISADDNAEAAMLLKAINDFERIGDHSVNLMESAQEIHEKELSFSDAAKQELAVLLSAVSDIVELTFRAFLSNDLSAAMAVEPLEEVVDDLTDAMRSGHIQRLQQGSCSIETGFVWTDLLTSLERVGDHCSNIAGCVIDLHRHDMYTHEALRQNRKGNARFDKLYAEYSAKYHL